MADIKFVYDLVNDLADKNNSRYIEEEEFNRYAQTSSDELFDELIGATNRRANRQTNVVIGVSQDLDRRLEPFRKGQTITIVDGEGTVPQDCGKILNVVTSKKQPKAIKRIDDDRLGMIIGNPLREPDADDIYYREGFKTFEIFGAIDTVYLNYLKTPTVPKYVTKPETITAGDRTVTRRVYDSDNSVNFEWDNREAYDLAIRILQKAGIPMKDAFIEQMVNNIKQGE